MTWGPWSPGLADEIERWRQLCRLQGVAACLLGSQHPLISALRAAEGDGEALDAARVMFDQLPALPKRRIMATFYAVTWPTKKRGRA